MCKLAWLAVVTAAWYFSPIVTAGWASPTTTVVRTSPARSVASTSHTTSDAKNWRYTRHNGHWWYWLPSQHWAYWTGNEWKVYDKTAYAQWWRQTRPEQARTVGGAPAVSRSAEGTWTSAAPRGRPRYEVGDFGYGGFGSGGYANGLAERRYEGLRYQAGRSPRVWSSPMPRYDTGFPSGIRGAGIGYGPYGGPVGRNLPGAIGNFGGANMGNTFGN
ncbi:MAG TPA: hypothetical protein VND64_08665 [Pirellulales bacterium]|nr:hypothetical protein [Pirellulales bacterium]